METLQTKNQQWNKTCDKKFLLEALKKTNLDTGIKKKYLLNLNFNENELTLTDVSHKNDCIMYTQYTIPCLNFAGSDIVISVDYEKFYTTINTIIEDKINMQIDTDTEKMTINKIFELDFMEAEKIHQNNEKFIKLGGVPAWAVEKIKNASQFTYSNTQYGREILQNVSLSKNGIVATDCYRICKYNFNSFKNFEKPFYVHKSIAKKLNCKKDITFYHSENWTQTMIEQDNLKIVCRNYAGNFPAIDNLYNQDWKYIVEISRKAFLELAKKVGKRNKDKANYVLRIDNKKISLFTNDKCETKIAELDNWCNEPKIFVYCNYWYFLEAVKNSPQFEDRYITLRFSETKANKPFTIDSYNLLLPVYIKDNKEVA